MTSIGAAILPTVARIAPFLVFGEFWQIMANKVIDQAVELRE
jgi:hypothetical protein